MRLLVVLLLVASAAGAVATSSTPSAAPATGWEPAVTLSRDGHPVGVVQAALDGAGNGYALWEEQVEAGCVQTRFGPPCPFVVRGAMRAGPRTWSPAVDLSAQGVLTGLRLAMSPSGHAVAGWKRLAGPAWLAEATRLRLGWEGAQQLSSTFDGGPFGIAVDSAGAALAVWVSDVPNVLRASFRPSAGVWSTAVELDRSPSLQSPTVSIDGAGNATAVWAAVDASGRSTLETARRDAATGSWEAAMAVSRPGDLIVPTAVVSHAGRTVTVAWMRRDGGSESVEANVRDTAGTWTGPVTLAPSTSSIGGLHLAVGAGGDAVAVWVARDGDAYVVHSSVRRAGDRAWGAPDAVSPPARTAFQPAVAVDTAGNAVAVWVGDDVVQTALRPAASRRWSAPTRLGPGVAPVVAIDPNGNGLAAWTSGSVRVSRLDGPAPSVTIVAPRRATSGRRVALAARVLPWAPLAGAPRWRFGDGATARGRSVTHRFRRVGVYRVSVTQTDVAGKTDTATVRIAIARPR
ncbi:MAG TPA: PKD domain-containing protein [Gaiellaceae bacterium]|jgi:hypothetical protein